MNPKNSARDPVTSVLLSVLREAQKVGLAPLLRTTLHKFVYLVDLYVAEEMDGQTLTGIRWKFLHFGPFAANVAASMDDLIGCGDILVESKTRADDTEFRLCTVRRGLGASLSDIGASKHAALRIGADLKRFSRDLSALLDYIYFRTSPMAGVRPGELLSFQNSKTLDIGLLKPITMQKISKSKLLKARAKLQEISNQPANKDIKSSDIGPYDEAYYVALNALEPESLPIGLSGRATIKIE